MITHISYCGKKQILILIELLILAVVYIGIPRRSIENLSGFYLSFSDGSDNECFIVIRLISGTHFNYVLIRLFPLVLIK